MNLHYMNQRLCSLVVFRELLQDPVIAAFQRMLASAELDDGDAFATACAAFEHRLSELPGYEKEREKVIANTEALLDGRPANNVLLYGDAGTGKSSAIKAIANEYAARGLRLVEVKKNQLYQIPDLMDQLAANPLKFILFIDDLSFTTNDDNFAALKAILEGSVGGRAGNIAVSRRATGGISSRRRSRTGRAATFTKAIRVRS